MATTPKAEPVSPPCSWDREGSFLQESSEGAGCDPERPFSEAAPLCPRLSCSAGPPPCSETLSQDGVQPPPVSDATQALFWASILQAQRCVLDLEGEIHRQREPVERELLGTPKPWPLQASPEPLLLESDSEEDSVERQEEEEESKEEEEEGDEEEEMEHLFYNNPLWGCSSRGATCDRDGLALWSCSEGDASVEREEGVATALSGSSPVPCSLGCQVRVASSPVPRTSFSEPEWDAASPVPAYVSHHRSSSPLVITEGDAEGFFSSTGNLEVGAPLTPLFPSSSAQPRSLAVKGALASAGQELGLSDRCRKRRRVCWPEVTQRELRWGAVRPGRHQISALLPAGMVAALQGGL